MQTINDLYDYGLKIYQDNDNFKFSLDSILLAEAVKLREGDLLLDLCTGNAPVPLILSTKFSNSFVGVEIQKRIYDMAVNSVKYNNLSNRINIINDNLKNINNYFPGNNFDIITCNPPYFKYHKDSLINLDESKAISRHEICITLEEIISVSDKMLKPNGVLYFVYRFDRIQELFVLLAKFKFGVKNLYIINTNNLNTNMFIIKAVKNGKFVCKTKIINIERMESYKNIFD